VIVLRAGLFEESLEANSMRPVTNLIKIENVFVSVLEEAALKISAVILNAF